MKKILFTITILLLMVSAGYCQDITLDDETKAICNQVMKNIYNDILKIKDKYDQLRVFNDTVLGKMESGLLGISYSSGEAREKKESGKGYFHFSLHVILIRPEEDCKNSFAFSYSNLGVTFYGCFTFPPPYSDLTEAIYNIVRKNVQPLEELNQKRSPLQLKIKSDKQVYEVGEEIYLEANIKNLTGKQLSLVTYFEIYSLEPEGKMFIYGRKDWRTDDSAKVDHSKDTIVLAPHQEAVMRYNLYDLQWNRAILSYFERKSLRDYLVAGKYGVGVSIQGDVRFTSNPITIEVREKKQEQPLVLTIKSDKRVYEAGEEIKIEATIVNNSEKEMIIFWNDKYPGIFRSKRKLIINFLDHSASDAVYIKPKTTFTRSVSIKNDFYPGSYVITIQLDNRNVILNYLKMSNQEIFTGTLSSNPITIEVKEKKQPVPFVIKPIKPKVSLDISRDIKTDIDKRMIDIAENTYPSRSEVVGLIKKGPFKLKEVLEEEKLWWYGQADSIKIPYCITAEAVSYYQGITEKARDEIWESDIEPSINFSYLASVVKGPYSRESMVFKDVYVVNLKLRFNKYFASVGGIGFEKERTVILDTEGKVLAVFGDGETGVTFK